MRRAARADFLADAHDLVLGEFAGKADRLDRDLASRRVRLVGPDRVDGIAVQRDEFAAGRLASLSQRVRLGDRVQPWVEAEPRSGGQICLDPFRRRRLDEAFITEDIGVGLVAHLQRVAAIDEDRCAVAQDDRRAGRTGEPRQPFQPVGARSDILALMLIRARHEKAVDAARRQFGAQERHALLAVGGIGMAFECLEHELLASLVSAIHSAPYGAAKP